MTRGHKKASGRMFASSIFEMGSCTADEGRWPTRDGCCNEVIVSFLLPSLPLARTNRRYVDKQRRHSILLDLTDRHTMVFHPKDGIL